jgi:hypothetical protein
VRGRGAKNNTHTQTRAFLEPFLYKMHHFTKAGSGQS